jgi:ribonuclease D
VRSRPEHMRYQYIDTSAGLEAALDGIRREDLLGVDTEAAGYHRYYDRLSLIQISTRDTNLVIDPLAIADLSALASILADPAVEKIFHDADFDLRILYRDLEMSVRSLFDTQVAAAFLGERQLGLGAIVEKFLGVRLPKAHQRADWAERPLSESMLEYAATDTAHLPQLRDRLLAELESMGRVAWAEEEFRRREATRWEETEDQGDAFLRIKGARDLSPRGLAILRELHGWRESVGRERDQATFRIMSNQTMLEIGLKAPTTIGALRGIQGISPGLADRRGRDLLAAVRAGLAVPESELPRFPPTRRWERDPAVEERAERLREVRARVAGKLNLDAGFLISRASLDEIAKGNPASFEELAKIPDVRKWQIEALGEEILGAISG